MKQLLYILTFFLGISSFGFAQNIRVGVDKDGVPVYQMKDINIRAKRSRRRDRRRFNKQIKKFNKLRYHIIKVLPYANEAAKNLKIIDAELARIPDEESRDIYLKARESFLFGKYEKDLRQLTISQGKVLVKLIDRQTGNNTYSLIQDFKSGASAFFWQSVGGLFGYDLKEEYDPEEEFAIEVIVTSIENGSNPTYYDYLKARNNR